MFVIAVIDKYWIKRRQFLVQADSAANAEGKLRRINAALTSLGDEPLIHPKYFLVTEPVEFENDIMEI